LWDEGGKTEDGRRKTEDRRRKTEDGKTEDGRQKTGDRRRETEDGRLAYLSFAPKSLEGDFWLSLLRYSYAG